MPHIMPDFPIGLRNGLISGEHRRRMGMAIWEFAWLVDHVTEEYTNQQGEVRGRVLGGTVIKAERLAADLDISVNTAQDSLKKLFTAGYIDFRRDAYGYRIEVRHSKKWTGKAFQDTPAPVRNGEQENRRTRDSEDSPTLHNSTSPELQFSCSPAPLDIAVSNDLTESNVPLLKKNDGPIEPFDAWDDVMRRASATMPALGRQLGMCAPVAVDQNTISVIPPPDRDAALAVSRSTLALHELLTRDGGQAWRVRFVSDSRARDGP
ncbi:MAG TPA: hypothetical protein VD902_16000 [Symbiobacteriaceae bacterium]|nr:hypothetical protein [Symbiobacteriaceae bacterium]